MFTSGPRAGEAIGSYQGEPLYHASLDAAEYEALLHAQWIRRCRNTPSRMPTCGGHTVWLARAA